MTDHLSKEKRSWNMSRIRSKDTSPEKIVRSMLHKLGFRFRLHRKDLPGKPDIILPKYKTAIFVHGCFWHRHPGCSKATTPKSNKAYWSQKFINNKKRDKAVRKSLETKNWKVLVIWECEISNPEELNLKLQTIRNSK